MSYADNQVTITQAKAQADIPPEIVSNRNYLTSTLGFKTGKGVKAYNLNVANTVVWQNCELSDVINPEGWSARDDKTSTDNVYFKEFNNSGLGAATDKRVAFSGQLDAPVASARDSSRSGGLTPTSCKKPTKAKVRMHAAFCPRIFESIFFVQRA
ncbi:unnamed protein product [Phytophthora lilii]|uniref:pectinesterase n=1 Tax=Phytophthora lilii TaxID=2077276 RepID=A0A9W6WQP0_9STRA|nr:unnamed protein product [Phytophthora lilii]